MSIGPLAVGVETGLKREVDLAQRRLVRSKCVMVAFPIRSVSARQVEGGWWGALGCDNFCSSGSFPCATRLIGSGIMKDSAVAVDTKLWAVSTSVVASESKSTLAGLCAYMLCCR